MIEEKILKKILQLDSLVGFLEWHERTEIHHYRVSLTLPYPRIMLAATWIIKENWEAPEMKYGQDRILYFYDPDSDTWLPDEYYLKLNPQYKQELINIKYL